MSHGGEHAHGQGSARRTLASTLATLAAVAMAVILLWSIVRPDGSGDGAPAGAAAEVGVGSEVAGAIAEGDHAPAEHLPAAWPVGVLPFAAILGAIAALPLIPATRHWWESNRSRFMVAMAAAAATLAYLAWAEGWVRVEYALHHAIIDEYIPFIVLLFSLYVISGGVRLSGDLKATPLTNTLFLAVGTLIASFIGTTGASMLLIRPVLQTNRERKKKLHTVIFFIFLVSNIGGTLLPIGDPPLFLGYLRGVPFWWTMHLWVEWAICAAILLAMYYLWDRRAYRHEDIAVLQRDLIEREPLRLRGVVNLALLGCVVLAVAFLVPGRTVLGFTVFPFLRELVMLGLVVNSLALTPSGVRQANQFNYHAIIEVAALFVGIFIAMQVPLMVLKATGPEITARMSEPWHYFWATGGLSAFLDNAPTYAVFFELAKTMEPIEGEAMVSLETSPPESISWALLVAVSLGSVFMGAMTYIGNGPNFMVKSIAEQSGVPMPSFFGFMKYSVGVLGPVFVLITVIFLL